MKRPAFFLLYAATFLPPLALYIPFLGRPGISYPISMAFGICSFIILANQFILASKPGFAVEALGTRGLLSFHATMPIAAIVFALAHKALKVGIIEAKALSENTADAIYRPFGEALRYGLGFADDTPQTAPGSFALVAMILLVVVAVLFMANTVFLRIKPIASFRTWSYKTTGLTYRSFRAVHDLLALAGIALLVHVALASSGFSSGLPFGVAWAMGWMILSLVLFARYKLSSMKKPSL